MVLKGKYRVKSITKKTRAILFKDLRPGDIIDVSFPIENTWKYVPTIHFENERLGETYESPNCAANYLACFEFEEID